MAVIEVVRENAKDAALVPMRMAIGASMVYHGTQKLRGEGPSQTGQFLESVGVRPGRFWAVATGVAEAFAGAAAVLGIATRPAALAILVTQGVAIARVHAPKGFENARGGMEYNLALVAIALGLLLAGPGTLSTHELLERMSEGRGARRWWRQARPRTLTRALRFIK